MIGLENGLVEGWIVSASNISPMSLSISFFWTCGYLKGLTLTGLLPSLRLEECSWAILGGKLVGMWNMAWYSVTRFGRHGWRGGVRRCASARM